MDPITDFLNENFVFSEKTLLIDKSKIKEKNLLIIIGISASGKSTLGEKLAKENDAFYLSSDKWIDDWCDKNKIDINDISMDEFIQCMKDLKTYMEIRRKKELVIAEGIHLCLDYETDIFSIRWACQYPFLILRKSLMRAAIQGYKRHPEYLYSNTKKFFYQFFIANKNGIKIIDKFIESRIKCSSEIEEVDESKWKGIG